MMTPTPSSKPSVVSVIDSIRNRRIRYDEDPFYRSTINIIGIQTLLVILIVVVFATGALYQQDATARLINERSDAAMQPGTTVPNTPLADAIRTAYIETMLIGFALLISLSGLAGVVVAQHALAPGKNALRGQKRFIGNIAHELRTPLSIIRTSSEVALMDPATSGYTRTTLESTIEELDRISETINNLLTINGFMRQGGITVALVDVMQLARVVHERHLDLARTRGVTLSLQGDEGVFIDGNAVALEQVLTNLTKNALTYTPEHDDGTVSLTVAENAEQVTISVIDTGIGIAQKDLMYIFEPFYRGDTSRARGVGSGTSGLGLAIVNDIVRAHSGTIVIRSALNKGTTIELQFPRAAGSTLAELPVIPEDDGEVHEVTITRA